MSDIPLSSAVLKSKVKVFLSLCRTRSFTETSKLLEISQSTVSRVIDELEADLNIELFVHNVRPVRLTAEGLLLQEFLSKQIMQLDACLSRLHEKSLIKRPLRLGVVESVGRILGHGIVKNLSVGYSPVTILTGVATYLIKLLDEDLLDVIICSDPFLNRNDLCRRFLYREPSIILAPESLPLSQHPSWKDLQFCGLPLIHYHRNNSGGKLENKLFHLIGTYFPNTIEVDVNALLLSFVADNLGWAITRPTTLTQHPELLSGIKFFPLPEPTISREIYVISRKGELDSLADSVSEIAVKLFSEEITPRILQFVPWVADYLFIGKEGKKEPVSRGIETDITVL